MLPLPPVITWTLAVVGAAALSKLLVKEWRRINAELDARERAAEPVAREQLQTLRRDPNTGVYRPE
jgi:HAMP domain-containing protein